MKPKNMAMTDTQIEKKGYHYVADKDFQSLPESVKRLGVVLNLDNKGNGTHWVGMKKIGENIYHYFDSYGVRPSYGIVHKSLIFYNDNQKQKINETNCGQRTIQWLNKQKK